MKSVTKNFKEGFRTDIVRVSGPSIIGFTPSLDDSIDEAADLVAELNHVFSFPFENSITVRRNLKVNTHGTDGEFMSIVAIKWAPAGVDPQSFVNAVVAYLRIRKNWRVVSFDDSRLVPA